MPDYKTMYFQLAARLCDAADLLTDAMRQGEEAYISAVEPLLVVLNDHPEGSQAEIES